MFSIVGILADNRRGLTKIAHGCLLLSHLGLGISSIIASNQREDFFAGIPLARKHLPGFLGTQRMADRQNPQGFFGFMINLKICIVLSVVERAGKAAKHREVHMNFLVGCVVVMLLFAGGDIAVAQMASAAGITWEYLMASAAAALIILTVALRVWGYWISRTENTSCDEEARRRESRDTLLPSYEAAVGLGAHMSDENTAQGAVKPGTKFQL
ncbi:Uu.00g000380.m01.CDS01 [Anthostomella pinea]|uniref:Uu.00g000380.m01.CDS01 n=1 Tax=Anthostomella pinea TaxID=933095 RepID=A0AAI8YG05_9PEZI|nr:Uu.00g000380.m01.CDS01 [Anthostomella pinea]